MIFEIIEEATFGDPDSQQRKRTIAVQIDVSEPDRAEQLSKAREIASADLDAWLDRLRVEGYTNTRRAMITQILNLYNSGEDEIAKELQEIVMNDLAGISQAEVEMIEKEFVKAKLLGELGRKHNQQQQQQRPHGNGPIPPSGGIGRRRSRG